MSEKTSAGPATLLLAGAGVLWNRMLLACGVRRARDGWRRAVGLVLRGEESTFVLSAFGLDGVSNGSRVGLHEPAAMHALIATRLADFLDHDAACHVRVRVSSSEDWAEPANTASFTLGFETWVDGARRFVPPTLWRPPGASVAGTPERCTPLFNVICRAREDGCCDLWIRANHVGIDGVPVQELLSRLEVAWGIRERVLYPTPEEFAPYELAHTLPGRADLGLIQMFVDFGPLLAWRKKHNARLPEQMTLAAAIQWRLGAHPLFLDLDAGSTVEVGVVGGLARGVGVVVVKPSAFARHPEGLARYVQSFNAQVEANRLRISTGCKTLDAAAFLPAAQARTLLLHALRKTPKAFGSVALTMLKDAKVFGAPIAEAGHDRGFMAIGSAALPTADGRMVGCVTIKGPRPVIAAYPAAIREALGSMPRT